jgi:hypothetical protein
LSNATVAISADSELGELEDRRERLEREVDAWRRMPIADIDPVFYADGLRERLEPLDVTLARIGAIRAAGGPRTGVVSASLPDDWPDLDVEARRTVAPRSDRAHRGTPRDCSCPARSADQHHFKANFTFMLVTDTFPLP